MTIKQQGGVFGRCTLTFGTVDVNGTNNAPYKVSDDFNLMRLFSRFQMSFQVLFIQATAPCSRSGFS